MELRLRLRGSGAVALAVDAMGEEENHEKTEECGSVCEKTMASRDSWNCHVDHERKYNINVLQWMCEEGRNQLKVFNDSWSS